VRAICFDLFTLFDPRSVVDVAERMFPGRGKALCDAWNVRQFQYSWLRAAARRYVDFEKVTAEALHYAAAGQKLLLTDDTRNGLVGAYSELEPWPDTREYLATFRKAGLRLAPLANFAPHMIERLLGRVELTRSFDALISTDAARTFKPDPRAYALGPERFDLPREEVAFAAFGGWDAAGAKWYGLQTFWVNRFGVPPETLAPPADATGATLAELARFVGV
jgi:2-haloacid dehalogenase